MNQFTSSFWSWFISGTTILSFIAVLWLIRWMSRGKGPAQGEKAETMGHVWDEDLAELNNPLPRWWLYLFYITIVFGAGYLLLYPGLGSYKGLLGWTEVNQYHKEMKKADQLYGPLYDKYQNIPIAKLVNDPQAVQMGRRLFATYCTNCHGSDARGVRGFPNLRDNDWLYGGTPKDIETTITNGRQGAMPTWGPILGHEGVVQVAEYVRSLSGRAVNPALAAKGQKIFKQNCTPCHGPEGKGNQLMGAPNLTDNIWLYGGSRKRIQESIAKGRQGKMPAQGEALGAAKVHLLATYVFSLRLDKDTE